MNSRLPRVSVISGGGGLRGVAGVAARLRPAWRRRRRRGHELLSRFHQCLHLGFVRARLINPKFMEFAAELFALRSAAEYEIGFRIVQIRRIDVRLSSQRSVDINPRLR